MALESGLLADEGVSYRQVGSLLSLVIPATLQGALMARLDRLEPRAKEVAQRGAVLGREFAEPEVAAYDYTEAGLYDQAIPSWQRDG